MNLLNMVRKVAELVNMLGNGKILVQRYGDILDGKRTWQKELNQSNIKHTLPDAEAGDLTSAIPYRTMTNIIKLYTSYGYCCTRVCKSRNSTLWSRNQVLQQ